jgi:predicted ATP-dependent protease
MLRDPVIQAVEAGNFHIYPVEHIDQGIELMTGIAAGKKQPDGTYPEKSINARVRNRLEKLAKAKHTFDSNDQDQQNNGR